MLDVTSLAKRLGSFSLAEVDLQVRTGEYFILLGPSGVGKTVLVELIAGLLRPDAGTIRWQGRNITTEPPEGRGFAVVYQDQALFPHLTVAKNIAYSLTARRKSRRMIAARVLEMAGLLGIVSLLHRRPATLSGGERQRVALARALAGDPSLVLLDEPLSALDVQARRQLRQELQHIHRETRRTFLHITHDLDEATYLGDRIGIMLQGRIHQVAPPRDILQRPADRTVAELLGMRNLFFAAELADTPLRELPGEDGAGALLIKPEEIILARRPYQGDGTRVPCIVQGWEYAGAQPVVRLSVGSLMLQALLTGSAFETLDIRDGISLTAIIPTAAIYRFPPDAQK